MKTCYDVFVENYNRNGYIIGNGYKLPLTEFHNQVEKCAYALDDIGVKRGDCVTLYLPTCAQALVVFYACSKLGIVANIVHPLTPVDVLKKSVEQSQSKVLFYYDALVGNGKVLADSCKKVVRCSVADYVSGIRKPFYSLYGNVVSKRCDKVTDYSTFVDRDGIVDNCGEGDDVVCYMHSGGTTGKAKTIMLSNACFNSLFDGLQGIFADNSFMQENVNKFSLVALPIFHAYGLAVAVHACLCKGYSLYLMPKFSSQETARCVDRYNVTFFVCVPNMLRKLLKCKGFCRSKLDKLVHVYCGGDSLDDGLEMQFNNLIASCNGKARVRRGYGLTETTSVCAVNTLLNNKQGSCGKPLISCSVAVVDEDDNILDVNCKGEIVVKGNQLMTGYVEGDNPFVIINGEKYLKTGDVGYIDDDGFVFVVDRKKRSFKISAVNVFPAEIEHTVTSKVSCVDEACAVPYVLNGKTYIRVFVTVTHNAHNVKALVIDACKKHLIKYSVPTDVVVIGSMPRTSFGKIDYKKLQESDKYFLT